MYSFGNNVWRSLFAILLGLVLVLWPGFSISYLVIVIGILLIISGATSLGVHYRMKRRGQQVKGASVDGWFSLLLGLCLLLMPAFFVGVLMTLLGILLIIASVGQFSALSSARREGYAVSGLMYLFPVLVLISGIVIIWNPFVSAASVIMLFGFTIIFYGIISLINQYAVRRSKR